MGTKLNVEGILLFEQPFARVPYENYRKVFRASQKNVERELGAVQSSSSDLASRGVSGSLGKDDALDSIDTMIGRVESLKRKLSDLQETAGKPTQDVMRERLHHLATVETLQAATGPEYNRWADTRLDRWLVDWSLRSGMEKTARRIAKDKNIETLVDIDLFMDIRRIENALSEHSCTEALAWCSENKIALRKMKSTLEFELRLQEYIELSRDRKAQDAIIYCRKYLLPWHETHLPQIRTASALLAFNPNTSCGPYKRLYNPARWHDLIHSFRAAIYTLNMLPTEPLLHLALYAGLASLKLPVCYDPATKNVDCPVCDGDATSGSQGLGLGKLAEEVPFSHHANSTIVCRISGKIMDEDNMPMAFPNGNVYSRKALEEMAAKNGGLVTCPRTGTVCDYSALRKVFIS
ncbi:Macrophage erythroblast attacher [Hypsizygus marmoreus]|uniref:Macrophage erythroblast attacher n=1 Tax=Hypsizygus marmoreus TaxID=39966 RepID=A0A369K839_HYPMA|nr:Macrophage erythroblast attacher [Hypsizygus marmoreus]